MAFFGVTVETVASARKHPNADRLDLVQLQGMAFQVVTLVSEYQAGDRVLYFPVDALLPPELQKKLGLEGKLAGGARNRVKTVRLRGELSQGLVGRLALIEGLPEAEWTPERITSYLGVEKHEPPGTVELGGKLAPLPPGQPVYDIEGADRFGEALERLLELEVLVTEKLEGSNFSVTAEREQVWVNQRQHTIEKVEGTLHSFWKVAEERGMLAFARELAATRGQRVVLHGEFLGPRVQSNIYKLAEHTVLFFDIKVGDRFLDVEPFLETLASGPDLKPVPQVAKGVRLVDWLGGRSVQEASNGPSLLAATRREGIVLRPMREEFSPVLRGRLILKQRSPEYLEKSEA